MASAVLLLLLRLLVQVSHVSRASDPRYTADVRQMYDTCTRRWGEAEKKETRNGYCGVGGESGKRKGGEDGAGFSHPFFPFHRLSFSVLNGIKLMMLISRSQRRLCV